MAETRIVEQGGFTRLFDGPGAREFGVDHAGSVYRAADGWRVLVWRRFATRDDALKVLQFIAELSSEAE